MLKYILAAGYWGIPPPPPVIDSPPTSKREEREKKFAERDPPQPILSSLHFKGGFIYLLLPPSRILPAVKSPFSLFHVCCTEGRKHLSRPPFILWEFRKPHSILFFDRHIRWDVFFSVPKPIFEMVFGYFINACQKRKTRRVLSICMDFRAPCLLISQCDVCVTFLSSSRKKKSLGTCDFLRENSCVIRCTKYF